MAKIKTPKYEKYKNNKIREKNKIKKIKKHLKTHPNNEVAKQRLQVLESLVSTRA